MNISSKTRNKIIATLVVIMLVLLFNLPAKADGDVKENQSIQNVDVNEKEGVESEGEDAVSSINKDDEQTSSNESAKKEVKKEVKKKAVISPAAIQQINSIADLESAFASAATNDTLTLTNNFKNEVATSTRTINLATTAGDTRNITIDGGNLELTPDAAFNAILIKLTHAGTGKVTFKNMSVKNMPNVVIEASGLGDLSLENMSFDSCFQALASAINGTTTIKDSKFLNGRNTVYGDNASLAHTINVENSYFSNNTGGSASSIAINSNATATIKTTTFEGNVSNAQGYPGGAIVVPTGRTNVNLTVEECAFYQNTSNGNQKIGGAIAVFQVNQSDIKIKNNHFEGNSTNGTSNTNDGGAIAFKNNQAHLVASVEISGNTFLKNFASDNGGAIIIESAHNTNSYANIFNNTFVQNRADVLGNTFRLGVGGAIQTYGSPKTVISHNTFYQNHNNSVSGGAAVGVNGNTGTGPSDTKVANNLFVDNTSTSATSKSKNVAFTSAGLVNVDNNGNVGYDAGQDFIPGDAHRNSLVKKENIFTEFYQSGDTMPSFAAVGDAKTIPTGQAGSAGNKYTTFSYIPSPRTDEMLRTNDPRTVTGVLTDVRGYPREALTSTNPYYPNAGAVEIYWTKFDPGIADGADWSSRFDVEAEGGLESLAYPGVFYKLNNPPTYVGSTPIYEQNRTFTRNTLVGPTNFGFTGWVDSAFNPPEVKDVNDLYQARKQTYVAQWTRNVFHLDFDLKGGRPQAGHLNDFDTQIIQNGVNNNLGSEPNSVPKLNGYDFIGWFDDDSATGVLWDFNNNQIHQDTTLYAKWKKSDPIGTYKVTFDMMGHGKQVPVQTVNMNDKAKKPTDPSEQGYVFKGWYTSKDLKTKYNFNTPVTKNTTLYAKWQKAEVQEISSSGDVTLLIALIGLGIGGIGLAYYKLRKN